MGKSRLLRVRSLLAVNSLFVFSLRPYRSRGECFRSFRRHRAVAWIVIFALLFADVPVPALRPLVSWAATVAFGPEDFVRSPGRPETVIRSFTVSNPNAAYTLCLANGGDQGQYQRVSSAEIILNKVKVVRPMVVHRHAGQYRSPFDQSQHITADVCAYESWALDGAVDRERWQRREHSRHGEYHR